MFKRKKVVTNNTNFKEKVKQALEEIEYERKQEKERTERYEKENKEAKKEAEKERLESEKQLLKQYCPVLKGKCRKDCASFDPPIIRENYYSQEIEGNRYHRYSHSIFDGSCLNDTVIRSRTNR